MLSHLDAVHSIMKNKISKLIQNKAVLRVQKGCFHSAKVSKHLTARSCRRSGQKKPSRYASGAVAPGFRAMTLFFDEHGKKLTFLL
jgi:hypothetical protein